MLIVVGIAGVMATIALPAFSNGLDNMRLSQAADSVAAFLNGAVNRAERRQQVMEISVTPQDRAILLRSADAAFARKLDLPEGVRVEAVLPAPAGDTRQPRRFLLLPRG